jgi:hypothetical protein
MEFKAIGQMAYKMATEHCNCANATPGIILGYSEFAHSIGLSDKPIARAELPTHFAEAAGEPFLSLIHQQQIVIFEAAFFDMLKLVLQDQPLRLSGRRQLEYAVVLGAASRDEIICWMVDREMNELKYKPVGDWFAYLQRLVSDCSVSEADAGRIAEAKASRDLLVHNAGLVNDIYIEKSGAFARYKVGEKLSVSGTYTLEVWQLLAGVSLSTIDKLLHTFTPSEEA